jgi:hypothetical protein
MIVGAKMPLTDLYHVPMGLSLGFIATVLAIAVGEEQTKVTPESAARSDGEPPSPCPGVAALGAAPGVRCPSGGRCGRTIDAGRGN